MAQDGVSWLVSSYSGEYLRADTTARGDNPFPYRDALIGMGILHSTTSVPELFRLVGGGVV